METGIYHDISHKDYHALTEIVSNSYLGRLSKVPAAARIPQDETEAMKFGRAFHSYVLDSPEVFTRDFVVVEQFPTKPNKRSTPKTVETWNEWLKALGDKQPISADDMSVIRKMNEAVGNHPFASKLLAEGISETTLIWKDEETGLMCKARPDRIPEGNKGVILDLKSTNNAAKNSFQSDCVKYGYAREMALYLEGYSILTKVPYADLISALIAAEKEPPYRVEVYVLDIDFIQYGWGEAHRLLQIEKKCRDENYWPHFQNAGAEDLFKPAYVKTWEWEGVDENYKDFSRGDRP